MGKRKPRPSAAARAGAKSRPKRSRSGKQGAELLEENSQLSEHDGETVDAESVQHEKKSNGRFQGIVQSDEDDTEDEHDASNADAPGDMISKGNGSDETETSCSFHGHVSHVITNEEIKALVKQNSKFKWEMPATDIPRSKWVGTGEKMQGTCDDHLHDVKGKLRDHWQHMLSNHLNSRMSFFSLCNSYRDIMHCNKKPFYLKSNGMDSSTMDAYVMHALHHVHRTRDVVIRNDAKLRNDADRDISDDNTYLDQGFTRPKVLFLLPLKSFARRVVKRLIQLSPLPQKKIDGGEYGKEKDFDFLSSIEIVVVDHADVISMQNWAHLEAVFEQLNHLPSKEHGTNVMRIRPWYLDQHAQYYRQTILLSSYLTPEINALFNGSCFNYEGKIKMVTEYTGVLPKIQLEVQQLYERFDASSIAEAADARFDYFCNKVFLRQAATVSNPLPIRATSQQDISRSRLWFFEGKKKILLYSERSHFYHRYKIRGTKHLLIYSLPERKEFYPELVNMLGESENRKCNVFFSRLDLLKLERIVGTSSARRLISSDKSMFVFC
nr:unnamed protein product [Digitaria exilis]